MSNAVTSLLDTPIANAEPKRDRWGRPLIHIPNQNKAVAFTRVTTLAGTLSDRFALEQWSNRMVILGIAQRRDLYAAASALTIDDKQALNDLAEQAREAVGSSAGATTGTALHKLTERLDAGEHVEAPEPWDRDLAAYQQALAEHGIEVLPNYLEQFMVCQQVGVAGTADRIVRHQGKLRISDLKTGSFLNWGEISIQLACYANAETHYNPASNTHTPAPDIDKQVGLVVHLPAGKGICTIYEVDLVAGWEWAQIAARVREWRKSKPAHTARPGAAPTQAAAPAPAPVEPIRPHSPDVQRLDWLKQRLTYLKTSHPEVLASVAGMWPLGTPTFTTDHAHTPGELEGILAAVQQAEAQHQVPFPETPCPRSSTELINAIKRLPADLIAELQANAAAEQLPHLAAPTTTGGQLNRAHELYSEVALKADMRTEKTEQALLSVVDNDQSLREALTTAVTVFRPDGPTTNHQQLTHLEAERLIDVCNAVADGLIVLVANTDPDIPGDWLLDVKDPGATLELLLVNGETKTSIRTEAVTVAEQLSMLEKPRSAADVAANPILAAALYGARHKPAAANSK